MWRCLCAALLKLQACSSLCIMMHSTLLQAEELCRAKGIELPQDFAEAAMDSGLRTLVLEEYIRLQVRS